MQTVTIPATFVCSTVKKPCELSVEIVDRLRCESVVEAAVRMACYSERLSGFVAICMALHYESRFVVLSQQESRQRACQFFCVWGLEVGGDSVGVGGGELGEGLYPNAVGWWVRRR